MNTFQRLAVLVENEKAAHEAILVCKQEIVGDMDVAALNGLSGKTLAVLRDHGIKEVSKLLAYTQEEILKFPGMGKKSLKEIDEALNGLFPAAEAPQNNGSDVPKTKRHTKVKLVRISGKIWVNVRMSIRTTLASDVEGATFHITSFQKSPLVEESPLDFSPFIKVKKPWKEKRDVLDKIRDLIGTLVP